MKKAVVVLIIIVGLFSNTRLVAAQTYTHTFTKDGNSYVVTKTISEGKVTIKTRIYDSSGNLINTKVVEKDAKPTPVKEITDYSTKSVTPATKEPSSKETPDSTNTPVPTKIPELKKTVSSTSYTLRSDLPLSVDEESGSIMVETEEGGVEVKTSPETIVGNAALAGLDLINELKLVASDGELKYVVKGNKQEKFLAIIKVNLPTSLIYATDTGVLEKVDQTPAVKLIDLLSF